MGRRHVIITGGGRGIGAATARRFAALGDRVTVMARTTKEIDTVADEIGGRSVRADVSDPASVEAAFMAAGPADVLVNAAGLCKSGRLVTTNVRTWEEILKVNLTGAYLCSLKVLPAMIRKGNGRIVNVASICGLRGYKYLVAYCASKHGLVGLTRSLASEVAEHGITVNAVCPGYVDTAMTENNLRAISEKTGRALVELRALIESQSPQKRLLAPDEVAAAIVFLASEEAQGLNGQAISICGGELNV
jgi:NAD(P)-dependent dehydrogenase (short-subunit alcohol dehydrogenase family)